MHSDSRTDEFTYERLLSHYRGDILDPTELEDVDRLLNTDPRWKAHARSIEFLDLERIAALQDAKDLQQFDVAAARNNAFCKTTAQSAEELFKPLANGKDRDPILKKTRREWSDHAQQCVYCRRMRRRIHAQVEREKLVKQGVFNKDELHLRDWLLEEYYLASLTKVTREMTKDVSPAALVFLIKNGRFVEPPTKDIGGWQCRSFAGVDAVALPALLDNESVPMRMSVEIVRTFQKSKGELIVVLRILEDDSVWCSIHAKSDEGKMPAIQNASLFIGQDEVLCIPTPDGEFAVEEKLFSSVDADLVGKRLRVRIDEGDALIYDSHFQFEA